MTRRPCLFVAKYWNPALPNGELRRLIASHLMHTGCPDCIEYLRAHFRIVIGVELLPSALTTRVGREGLLPLLLPDEPVMLTVVRH